MILQRLKEDIYGTHGELLDNYNAPTGIFTLEQLWRNNENNISCIPTGDYDCSSYSSDHFKDVYQVKNVPNRQAILIHAGNTVKDTHGCILVGLQAVSGGVAQSQKALAYLRTLVSGSFRLRIRGIGDSNREVF